MGSTITNNATIIPGTLCTGIHHEPLCHDHTMAHYALWFIMNQYTMITPWHYALGFIMNQYTMITPWHIMHWDPLWTTMPRSYHGTLCTGILYDPLCHDHTMTHYALGSIMHRYATTIPWHIMHWDPSWTTKPRSHHGTLCTVIHYEPLCHDHTMAHYALGPIMHHYAMIIPWHIMHWDPPWSSMPRSYHGTLCTVIYYEPICHDYTIWHIMHWDSLWTNIPWSHHDTLCTTMPWSYHGTLCTGIHHEALWHNHAMSRYVQRSLHEFLCHDHIITSSSHIMCWDPPLIHYEPLCNDQTMAHYAIQITPWV